jgi:hypothetical protein
MAPAIKQVAKALSITGDDASRLLDDAARFGKTSDHVLGAAPQARSAVDEVSRGLQETAAILATEVDKTDESRAVQVVNHVACDVVSSGIRDPNEFPPNLQSLAKMVANAFGAVYSEAWARLRSVQELHEDIQQLDDPSKVRLLVYKYRYCRP